MGSFGSGCGAVQLSNNLNQTLASGERVLSLLEEKPLVEEIPDGIEFHAVGRFNDVEKQDESGDGFTGAEASHVTFAYEDETILDDYSLKLASGKITGYPRFQRLRKIHTAEASHAFLGCERRKYLRR